MITAIIYILVFTYGAFKAMAGRPLWGIYIYFWSFYLHAPTQWWGQSLPDLRWSLLAGLITLVSLCLYKKSPWRFWGERENKLLCFLFLVVLAQWPFTISPSIHSEYVFLLLKFIFFIFLLQNALDSTEDIEKIIFINIMGGAYLAYMGMGSHDGGRLGGVGTSGMDDSNLLGLHFVALLFMGSYLLLYTWKKTQWLTAVGLTLILMAIFLTESRGAILSIFAAGFLSLLIIPKNAGGRWFLFAIAAVMACSVLMGPQIVERFSGVGKDVTGDMIDVSAQSRGVIIAAEIEMFKHSPFLGHGNKGTLLLSPQFIPEEFHAQGTGVRASHNVAMSFLVDHGMIGFLLYFGAIFSAGLRGFASRRQLPSHTDGAYEHFKLRCMLAGCVLGLAAFMIGGMSSNNKKLEADIWLIALIPIIHCRIIAIEKNNLQRQGKEE